MVDLLLRAYRLDDLSGEALSWVQDLPISGGTKLNSLADDRRHGTSKNSDNSERPHLQKGWKKRRER